MKKPSSDSIPSASKQPEVVKAIPAAPSLESQVPPQTAKAARSADTPTRDLHDNVLDHQDSSAKRNLEAAWEVTESEVAAEAARAKLENAWVITEAQEEAKQKALDKLESGTFTPGYKEIISKADSQFCDEEDLVCEEPAMLVQVDEPTMKVADTPKGEYYESGTI